MATKAVLCVLDVNKVAGTVTVYSPAGRASIFYPKYLPLDLARRIMDVGLGVGSALVGASRVFPIVLTYAERIAVLFAELSTNEERVVASYEAPEWRANCA